MIIKIQFNFVTVFCKTRQLLFTGQYTLNNESLAHTKDRRTSSIVYRESVADRSYRIITIKVTISYTRVPYDLNHGSYSFVILQVS